MCKENFYAKMEKLKAQIMQVQETGTPKLCPGRVILESKLTTAEVDRGEGKSSRSGSSFTYQRQRFLN